LNSLAGGGGGQPTLRAAFVAAAIVLVIGDVTLTANTASYSARKNLAPREINDLGCAKAGLVGHPNGYTQLM
jgi:hypothetical protein